MLRDLINEPYKFFSGVDYQRIMALDIPAIKIDTKNLSRNMITKNEKSETYQVVNHDVSSFSSQNGEQENAIQLIPVCGLLIDIEKITI